MGVSTFEKTCDSIRPSNIQKTLIRGIWELEQKYELRVVQFYGYGVMALCWCGALVRCGVVV